MRWRWLSFAGGAALAAACSSSTSATSTTSADAGAPGDDAATPGDDGGMAGVCKYGGDGGTDGGTCDVVPAMGNDVTEEFRAEDPPAPAGGTIADGTYYLYSYVNYTGAGGRTGTGDNLGKSTMEICGHTELFRSVLVDPQVGTTDIALAFTISASETSIVETQTCPVPQSPVTKPYTASATSLAFFYAATSSTRPAHVDTYLKQ